MSAGIGALIGAMIGAGKGIVETPFRQSQERQQREQEARIARAGGSPQRVTPFDPWSNLMRQTMAGGQTGASLGQSYGDGEFGDMSSIFGGEFNPEEVDLSEFADTESSATDQGPLGVQFKPIYQRLFEEEQDRWYRGDSPEIFRKHPSDYQDPNTGPYPGSQVASTNVWEQLIKMGYV